MSNAGPEETSEILKNMLARGDKYPSLSELGITDAELKKVKAIKDKQEREEAAKGLRNKACKNLSNLLQNAPRDIEWLGLSCDLKPLNKMAGELSGREDPNKHQEGFTAQLLLDQNDKIYNQFQTENLFYAHQQPSIDRSIDEFAKKEFANLKKLHKMKDTAEYSRKATVHIAKNINKICGTKLPDKVVKKKKEINDKKKSIQVSDVIADVRMAYFSYVNRIVRSAKSEIDNAHVQIPDDPKSTEVSKIKSDKNKYDKFMNILDDYPQTTVISDEIETLDKLGRSLSDKYIQIEKVEGEISTLREGQLNWEREITASQKQIDEITETQEKLIKIPDLRNVLIEENGKLNLTIIMLTKQKEELDKQITENPTNDKLKYESDKIQLKIDSSIMKLDQNNSEILKISKYKDQEVTRMKEMHDILCEKNNKLISEKEDKIKPLQRDLETHKKESKKISNKLQAVQFRMQGNSKNDLIEKTKDIQHKLRPLTLKVSREDKEKSILVLEKERELIVRKIEFENQNISNIEKRANFEKYKDLKKQWDGISDFVHKYEPKNDVQQAKKPIHSILTGYGDQNSLTENIRNKIDEVEKKIGNNKKLLEKLDSSKTSDRIKIETENRKHANDLIAFKELQILLPSIKYENDKTLIENLKNQKQSLENNPDYIAFDEEYTENRTSLSSLESALNNKNGEISKLGKEINGINKLQVIVENDEKLTAEKGQQVKSSPVPKTQTHSAPPSVKQTPVAPKPSTNRISSLLNSFALKRINPAQNPATTVKTPIPQSDIQTQKASDPKTTPDPVKPPADQTSAPTQVAARLKAAKTNLEATDPGENPHHRRTKPLMMSAQGQIVNRTAPKPETNKYVTPTSPTADISMNTSSKPTSNDPSKNTNDKTPPKRKSM